MGIFILNSLDGRGAWATCPSEMRNLVGPPPTLPHLQHPGRSSGQEKHLQEFPLDLLMQEVEKALQGVSCVTMAGISWNHQHHLWIQSLLFSPFPRRLPAGNHGQGRALETLVRVFEEQGQEDRALAHPAEREPRRQRLKGASALPSPPSATPL